MRRVARRGPGNVTVAIVASVAIVIGLYLAFTKEVPFRSHFELKAAFRDSNGLRAGSPVRIAGVEVGEVSRTEAYGDGAALVTMRMQDKGLPVHEDARLKIRPRLFFEGNFFVDLKPGTPRAPTVRDGDVIGLQQTSNPVQFDQVLSALKDDTREDLRTVLDEYGRALNRGAAAANRTFDDAGPAFRDGARFADAQLGERPRDLSEYIRDAGVNNRALDRDPEALKSLITAVFSTARGFVREEQALEDTLEELPRVLRVGRPALRDLNRAFPPVRRLIADLRPALRSSPTTLDASLPLARQTRRLVSRPELRGLSRELRAAVPDLARFNEASVPLAREGAPLAECQNRVLVPFGEDKVQDPDFPAKGIVREEYMKSFVGLSGESRSGDANGQWFRVFANPGNRTYQLGEGEFFQTALPILGTNPPPVERRPPIEPGVPCETQSPPDLRTKRGAPPQEVRTNLEAPGAKRRAAQAEKVAVEWLKDRIEYEGLGDVLSVKERELTSGIELPRAPGARDAASKVEAGGP